MLDNLTTRLSQIVKTVKGQARLTEANIQDALREVRMALLEADVALPVVKNFINQIKERALGREVLDSLTPGQALIGIVNEELIQLMGTQNDSLNLSTPSPAVILMAGLQGAGKTTTTGKLAKKLTEQKKKVLLVSTDVYRPAAIEQLTMLAQQLKIECFSSNATQKPQAIATAALEHAKKHIFDVLIVDTAGRLAIDQEMMQEIQELHTATQPIETLFVVDAMQGQDAVNTAQAFNEVLPLTGVVLTKMDGDSRGGAALSVRQVTGKPIKFIGTGEKLDGLEPFHPDRIASRILGMGDVLTLIEDVQKGIDQKKATQMAHKLNSGKQFDLEDFKAQIEQVQHMGGITHLLKKMPGQFGEAAKAIQGTEAEKKVTRISGIINSMTPKERKKPELIKASRKRRIATGAGVTVQDVNLLLNQFEQVRKTMKQFSKGGLGKLMRSMKGKMPRF